MTLTWPDYVIIGIILVSTLISLVRGFVREALSLAFLVIAFWVAKMFFHEFSGHLTPWIEVPSLRMGAAFFLIFVVVWILGGLLTFLVAQLIDATGLSGTDRVIGMMFGFARGVLLVAALVMLAGLTPFPNDPWWRESRLVGEFRGVAEWLRSLLPDDLAQRVQPGAAPTNAQKPAGG